MCVRIIIDSYVCAHTHTHTLYCSFSRKLGLLCASFTRKLGLLCASFTRKLSPFCTAVFFWGALCRSLEQEYQDQLRHSQAELEREEEAQSSQSALLRQTSEQLQGLQQQVANLKERLAEAESVSISISTVEAASSFNPFTAMMSLENGQ